MTQHALVLERVSSASARPRVTQNWVELANQSHALLGYYPLKERILNATRPYDLMDYLGSVNLLPFTEDSVGRYARAKAASINRPRMFIKSLLLCVLCLSILTVIRYVSGEAPHFSVAVILGVLMLCVGAIFGSYMDLRPSLRWGKTILHWYREPVPAGVLQIAIKIAERFPDARFYVYSLGERQDPFLSVECGGEEFFIAVWDEPQFGIKTG